MIVPWAATPSATLSAPDEPLPWEHSAWKGADQPVLEEQAPEWLATPPATLSAPVEPLAVGAFGHGRRRPAELWRCSCG